MILSLVLSRSSCNRIISELTLLSTSYISSSAMEEGGCGWWRLELEHRFML